jgi:hypothetical protein
VALLLAVCLRPYSVPAKNVLLVAMNATMVGASAATVAAVRATTESHALAMAELASHAAAAAAMLGFVSIAMSLARFVVLRLVLRASIAVDLAALSASSVRRSGNGLVMADDDAADSPSGSPSFAPSTLAVPVVTPHDGHRPSQIPMSQRTELLTPPSVLSTTGSNAPPPESPFTTAFLTAWTLGEAGPPAATHSDDDPDL